MYEWSIDRLNKLENKNKIKIINIMQNRQNIMRYIILYGNGEINYKLDYMSR